MRDGRKFRLLTPEGETGSAATTPAIAGDIPAAEQHVQQARAEVGQAAQEIPSGAMHELLTSLKSTLDGVQSELKRSNDRVEKELKPAETIQQQATPPEPEVVVETPAAIERKVRRGNRKVTRRG